MTRFAGPKFRARPPWWGPDLQTLRNVLRGPSAQIQAATERRLILPLADGSGDALCGELAVPLVPPLPTPEQSRDSDRARPLVVLVHGLSGSAESAYMVASASQWLKQGYPVVRLSLRGAGASRDHCRFQYHAGRSEDLRDALSALDPDLRAEGLILVGYSLGGNVVLKFLAEYGPAFEVRAAASVSAPIDLSAASQRFLDPRNKLYQRHLLAMMKRECFGGKAEVSKQERRAVEDARTIYEFDDHFVGPRNGYRDAEHYYAENHARQFLGDIRVPTLLIHALDDPWIPREAYTTVRWEDNVALHPLLVAGGGHVGFHGSGDDVPWHDRCIGLFAAECGERRVRPAI